MQLEVRAGSLSKLVCRHVTRSSLGSSPIDTASAAGKFMLTILAGAAEMERNLTRERTRAAMHVKRRRGERISRYAPFGSRLAENGYLVTDRNEQRAVRLVRQLHADGLSLRKIAAELLSRGMSGRRGQPNPRRYVP